jgi:hypothetical protein
MSETKYHPGSCFDSSKDRVASRKERFQRLNRFVTERHGWLVSIPARARRKCNACRAQSCPTISEVSDITFKRMVKASAFCRRLLLNVSREVRAAS